jgi:hypothetical protein
MSQVTISAGQSLADVCLQVRGSLEALYELADLNGLPITATLTPGQVLQLPSTDAPAGDVVRYYAQRSLRINTLNESAAEVPTRKLSDFLAADIAKADFN